MNSRRQRIKQSSNPLPVIDLDEVIRREGTTFIDLVVETLGSMKLEIKIEFFLFLLCFGFRGKICREEEEKEQGDKTRNKRREEGRGG